MTCKKCGYENKEESIICEFCKSELYEEEKEEKSLWDRLFIINILTCSIVILLSLLILLIFFIIG